ncbi:MULTISPECIES: HD-GYP domain-containing protein [unclassified Sedimentibacter]|uniref:HD-GYP domain-containing protein n=1 Tax=unclassified Sedimentibacter TaxID=2649220 RepID=UPI0027E12660|nr:HD-GYP domain-containing protein [Sedimentibacter sp. MB35-C1]WMJ78101.1 HD-GYP domain-containing protein [Sedimentibacter sp. MB35-C1]
MYITKEHLKSGMILARDIILNERNLSYVLLTRGQPLNARYINKILFHDITGVFIENDAFDDMVFEQEIDRRLESKALTAIRSLHYELERNDKSLSFNSIDQFSVIIDDLISDILSKRKLTDNILEFKNHDEYTYQHCLNVANLSITTGIAMGLKGRSLHTLGMAALLHDIGKTAIPTEILNKPGALTAEEFELMKTHPIVAVDILKNYVSEDILVGIKFHHERADGSGYPYGRTNDNIPLYSKIISISDVYHALNSERSYRKMCFPNEIMEYLMGNAGSHFDYDVLKVFLKNVVAFPVGTFVKLSNGKLGVVIKNYIENNMRPKIRVVNPDNTVGEDIDLLNDYQYMNVTVVDMGYKYVDIDFGKIKKAKTPPKK